jgi:predicted TIM-barrel fold metal-dependent hydrolase
MGSVRAIDCCLRAVPPSEQAFLRHVPLPFRGLGLGHPFGYRYVPPVPDLHPDVATNLDEAAASDPDAVGERRFQAGNVDAAILIGPNWLLRPDQRHDAVVAAATNEWLASDWLEGGAHSERFFASIHVSPASPQAAVREIERWAVHPRFVQVAVPLHVHAPYGDQRYFEIWEAAAAYGLPIAVHGDGTGGAELPPTMAGFPAHFIEYFSLLPLGGVVHFTSLIAEGVFDRLPNLVFVFTDGGLGLFPPLLWRQDAKARALKEEMPWVTQRPTSYLADHARFTTRRYDLVEDSRQRETVLRLAAAHRTLLYGSNYPMWDFLDAEGELELLPDATLEAALRTNPFSTYPKLAQALELLTAVQ